MGGHGDDDGKALTHTHRYKECGREVLALGRLPHFDRCVCSAETRVTFKYSVEINIDQIKFAPLIVSLKLDSSH